MKDLAAEIERLADENESFNGCFTGDCPHEAWPDCYNAQFKAGAAAHASLVKPTLEEVRDDLRILRDESNGRLWPIAGTALKKLEALIGTE